MPRTPDGKPDLQGNWTNETQTPLERMGAGGTTLTDEQARVIEDRAQLVEEYRDKASDPNRPAPAEGRRSRQARGARRTVLHRENFRGRGRCRRRLQRLLAGSRKERDPHRRRGKEARSSSIRRTGACRASRMKARSGWPRSPRGSRKYGEFDHPEMRPLADRCLLSFGSNAGPPMLPNYFYNNNYTIVQTPDNVMILSEMVHDVRIIRLNAKTHVNARNQPWLGDSIGRWEGDTLGRRDDQHSPDAARAEQHPVGVPRREREPQGHRALHAHRPRHDRLSLHDGGSGRPSRHPFTGELPFTKIDEMVYEYACHEGNYAMTNILSGERSKGARRGRRRRSSSRRAFRRPFRRTFGMNVRMNVRRAARVSRRR
jgi:hypothetical protein